MLRQTILALAVTIVSAVPTWAQADEGASSEGLSALAKRLAESGRNWLAGRGEDDRVLAALDEVQYTRESLPALKRQLMARREDPIDLYVANRLLRPVARLDPLQKPGQAPDKDAELIRMLVPTVQALRARAHPLPFPTYSPSHLRRLGLPEYDRKVPPERLIADMMHYEQLRERKVTADRKVALHNAEVAALTIAAADLILRAGNPAFDQILVRMVAQAEQAKRRTYEAVLDRIREAAASLDKARAASLHRALLPLGTKLRMKRAEYADLTKPMLATSENSCYGRPRDEKGKLRGKPNWAYPGIEILKTVNELAEKQGLPAQRVPTAEQIDALFEQESKNGN